MFLSNYVETESCIIHFEDSSLKFKVITQKILISEYVAVTYLSDSHIQFHGGCIKV